MRKCKHCDIEMPSNRGGLVCTTCKNGLDRYKLTRPQMLELHKSQDGKCKICNDQIEMFTGRQGGYIIITKPLR